MLYPLRDDVHGFLFHADEAVPMECLTGVAARVFATLHHDELFHARVMVPRLVPTSHTGASARVLMKSSTLRTSVMCASLMRSV